MTCPYCNKKLVKANLAMAFACFNCLQLFWIRNDGIITDEFRIYLWGTS